MKKIFLFMGMLPLLQQEAGAQHRSLPENPSQVMERPFASRNTDMTARTDNALQHNNITDLGEIAEGQTYQFKTGLKKGQYYPPDPNRYISQSEITSIMIPENSGILGFTVSANNQFIVTLDTKDRYGDYNQQVTVGTKSYGNLVFVFKAHIVDAGALKAAAGKKEAH